MLPNHMPASCLPRILKDFAALIKKDCDPSTDPLMWLAGCDPEHDHAFLPYEGEPEDDEDLVLDPVKRLDGGEELAIRLHTAFWGEEMMLIDGQTYMPLGGPSDDDEEQEPSEDDDYYDIPSEMSFFALGVKRDRDRLSIRPVSVHQCSNPGGIFHRSRLAVFPKRFLARIEQYVASLT